MASFDPRIAGSPPERSRGSRRNRRCSSRSPLRGADPARRPRRAASSRGSSYRSLARVLRRMVAHLVIDARDPGLGRSAAAHPSPAALRPNVNLLGEAVLGAREAQQRLEGTRALLARDDVDYVSIKVSATVAPHSPWAFDEAVDDIVVALQPLFEQAAAAPTPKFINLDMEEYKDLDLTIAVFRRILDAPRLDEPRGRHRAAGVPARRARRVPRAARTGRASAARRGGAGIKVRVVKGANLPMERVDADAPRLAARDLAHASRRATRTTSACSTWRCTPERIDDVRIGVAGHNLFDLAFARHLARERGVEAGVEFEMLLGMAPGPSRDRPS